MEMVFGGDRKSFASPVVWLLVGLLSLAGLGIRLSNLTNLPLDFHPTRQLRSAIIARGMYYESLPDADPQVREKALSIWSTMEAYEPPLLERLVAFSYRILGGERLWVARVYSSLFWMIGGLALYALARRMFSPAASLFSLGFYLLLPWGVVASRSFQPDPMMVMGILLAVNALYRWIEDGACSWLWTVLAGGLCGLAILIKAMALYPVVCVAAFLLLSLVFQGGKPLNNFWQLLRRKQVWVFAAVAAVIPAVYYLGLGERSSDFASFWVVSFGGLLSDRKFYIHWLGLIRGIMDIMIFFAALLGVFLFPRRGRLLAGGLWLGYFLIGATFPFQIYTHDYYSIVLVPIVAFSLAPYADLAVQKLTSQPRRWKVGFAVLFFAITSYYAYTARQQLFAMNYRPEQVPWQKMAQEIPAEGSIIALTHDYGDRLKYFGWRTVNCLWPAQGDLDLAAAAGHEKIDNFEAYFKEQTAGIDYFLVTLFGDLDAQPALKSMLYDHYAISQQGDGYVLFDLRQPKE